LFAKIENVSVDSIASTLPVNIQKLDEEFLNIPSSEISKIKSITGFDVMRYARKDVTSSDLCFNAAEVLKSSDPLSFEDIDVVIFVSQSRDYILPNTASILQSRLGLSPNCFAIDIPNGCAGYIHGLFVASTFLSTKAARRVLLLCGETNSRLINSRDHSMSMIFGDAGTATLLSFNPKTDMNFNVRTDGSNFDKIIIPHGGFREPASPGSFIENERENKNFRCELDMTMDGMSVFNFAISKVPEIIIDTLSNCNMVKNDISLLALHQANELIVNKIAKKCGIDKSIAPFLAGQVGNTGPASIPLLLSEGFSNKPNLLNTVLMCGFGVGLNWGTCLTDLSRTTIHRPVFL